jgi:uncharacterized membrane protein
MKSRHPISWLVFAALWLLAAILIHQTAADLPPRIAVHFDAAGQASSYMLRGDYRVFMLLFAGGLPALLVGIMTIAYSRATDLKIPDREYWLAPERLAATRAFLIAHAVWLGSMLIAIMCFVHWLVWEANQRQPPSLSNQSLLAGTLVVLLLISTWIATLMLAFRRPTKERR